MSHTEKMREALRKVRPYLEDGADHGDDSAELLKLVDEALTAPAAEVPTDGWLQEGGLLYRLTDDRSPVNRDEINVTMADGSRSNEDRARRAGELLDRIRGGYPQAAAEVPEAMGDEQIDVVTQAWAGLRKVELHRLVQCRDYARRVIAARDAQWQSTRLCGGVPEGWPRKATPEMVEAFKEAYKHGSIWTDRLTRAVEAMLEAAPQAPALDAGVRWFTVAEHGMPDVGEEVIGGLWYTDPWLKPEVATRFMWGLCRALKDDHRDFKDGKRWQTFGPSHNEITHWARLNMPAMPAQAGKGGA